MSENDIVEVVDEIVDDMDPTRVESEAERLGITTDNLIDRCVHEMKSRLTGFQQ
jgi:hypothetical protein